MQERGGVPAVEDELVEDGVVRAGAKVWVTVTRVQLEDDPPAEPFDPLPLFRFVISDENHRPLHSFAIDSSGATDQLQLAHPTREQVRVPAPAFAYEALAGSVIRRGDDLFLTMSMVSVEHPSGGLGSGRGIRFAVADEDNSPLYSFTMDWPLAFLVMGVAWKHG